MVCCKLEIFEQSHTKTFKFQKKTYKKRVGRNIRSGTIILDIKNKKVLLIQSYKKFWGLPKGHKEDNETLIECAIRETFEETGIVLKKEDLLRCYSIYNGDGIYYIVDGTNLSFDVSKIDNKEEITGICWVCTECLKYFSDNEEISINKHLKVLIPTIQNELL